MSEVFDPEKVTRWASNDVLGIYSKTEPVEYREYGDWVEEAEYDKLLALYREAVDALYAADEELNGEP